MRENLDNYCSILLNTTGKNDSPMPTRKWLIEGLDLQAWGAKNKGAQSLCIRAVSEEVEWKTGLSYSCWTPSFYIQDR